MPRKTSLLAVALIVFVTATAQAVDFRRLLWWRTCWPDCLEKTCCDDYCPKPAPCVPRIGCFGCDDYCPKPAPCVPRIDCFGCDDYCPKCPPVIRCTPCADLKCVPTEPCGCRCGCGPSSPCQQPRHKTPQR